jgi:hypothetical protein
MTCTYSKTFEERGGKIYQLDGLIFAIIVVLELPPSESWK